MDVLYANSPEQLQQLCVSFAAQMEPFVGRLEQAARNSHPLATSALARDYIQVCRWPFRQLEYSFALEALISANPSRGTLLEAGCGITPFGHALAAQGYDVHCCDYDQVLVKQLEESNTNFIYGSSVAYSWQNLASLQFASASFDAVTCISVLEHIPPPYDRQAVRELIRVLKPGGILVLTIDFEPRSSVLAGAARYGDRAATLLREGGMREIIAAAGRKFRAFGVQMSGQAKHARSANQPFTIEHISDDIQPELRNCDAGFRMTYQRTLGDVSPEDAARFWNLEAGLFEMQHRRLVLPAAIALVKQ